MQTDETSTKRASHACQRCRKQKIKCSGSQPCRTCYRRGTTCVFAEDKKIIVSEKYIRDLNSRLSELQKVGDASRIHNVEPSQSPQQNEPNGASPAGVFNSIPTSRHHNEYIARASGDPSPPHRHVPATPSDTYGTASLSDDVALFNPLVPKQPAYVQDDMGRLRYLGHSSTFSFNCQVLNLVGQSIHDSSVNNSRMQIEGDTYPVNVQKLLPFDSSLLSGLPSSEVALHNLHNLEFRIRPFYQLFDEVEFGERLRLFYRRPADYACANPLWFCHYLVVMAFGKVVIPQGLPRENAPGSIRLPGSELFDRALRLLPDPTYLCRHAIESSELLCCIALYLQSIDHRNAAHVYEQIGQALRIAQLDGLHTDIQAETVGGEMFQRGRRIWWTIYVLDRKMSASSGLPSFVRDEDVTTSFDINTGAGEGSAAAAAMIHVKISRLLGRVISTVYSAHKQPNNAFLKTTEMVVKGVAELSEELKAFIDGCFGEISRVASSVELAYHQCIILCCRPVLFHILARYLNNPHVAKTRPLSSPTKGLVQICVSSALEAVRTLHQLKNHDLLDTFLPFDLDCASSAAFVLVMSTYIHAKLIPSIPWYDNIMDVFDAIAKVNNLGKTAKERVERLHNSLLAGQSRTHDQFQTNSLDTNFAAVSNMQETSTTMSVGDVESVPSLGNPFFDEWTFPDGLSADQMMSLANALAQEDFQGNFLQAHPGEPC